MRVRMLGPLRVRDGSGWATIDAAQQRVVLAVLLVEMGRAVTTQRLVEEVWGERPPRTAVHAIHVYIRGLRRMLGDDSHLVLKTQDRGYLLALAHADVDAAIFERSILAGRRCLAGGDLEQAASLLAEGLALWEGAALADVPASPAVAMEAARLEQARLGAMEDRMGALLDLGRHADVVDELRRLAGEHPLREKLQAHLMLALHRCGRRTEALAAYQRAREQLVEELGLEPNLELRRLHRAILADEPIPAGPGAVTGRVLPAQLPPDIAGFTGRESHIARLDAVLSNNDSSIVAITGAAGVGKSALAVHWAHRVQERFPDGQLHVNLRGYAAGSPLRPIDALAGFLRALEVPAEKVPVEVNEATALYRSLLAGKRMLILVDNANHPDQLRPLLPGSPRCLVLTTSRDQLRGLVARDGARPLTVEALPPVEARALLTRLLGNKRATMAPDAVARLATLCGHLPLAIRIAAANLASNPHQTIAGYVAELSAGDRLAALEVDGDPHAGVRTAFDHSYAALPDGAGRLFRWCGLAPGPDITVEAAAALGDIPAASAIRLLGQLCALHLLQEHAPGRYAMHDLLRLYAAERASNEDDEPDRQAALARLFDFYFHGVDAAAQLLYPHIVRLPSPSDGGTHFDNHEQAHAWLDHERPNLVAAVSHAPNPLAWRLADAMRGYLHLNMCNVDWQVVAHTGLAAAIADGSTHGQAAAHLSLALLHWVQDRHEQAVEHSTRALALTRACDWIEGEATALNSLAGVHWSIGELVKAAEYVTAALDVDMRTGQVATQATKLGNLGIIYSALGRLQLADEVLTRALALNRQIGSLGGEARALAALGEVYHTQGSFEAAAVVLGQARALHQTVGDRSAEGSTIQVLAALHRDMDRPQDALDLVEEARALGRETGNRRVEAYGLSTYASVQRHLGNCQLAIAGYRDALELARDIADHYLQTEALIGLANEGGAPAAQEALALARRYGYRVLEGNALVAQAAIHLDQGALEAAIALAEQALSIHTETGHRLGLTRAEVLLIELGQEHRTQSRQPPP